MNVEFMWFAEFQGFGSDFLNWDANIDPGISR